MKISSILRCGVQNYTQKQLHEILTAKNPLLEVPYTAWFLLNISGWDHAFLEVACGIPREIWNRLSNPETLIVGLKEHKNMTYVEIAELVDRDEFEIKIVYEGAGKKLGRRAPYTI